MNFEFEENIYGCYWQSVPTSASPAPPPVLPPWWPARHPTPAQKARSPLRPPGTGQPVGHPGDQDSFRPSTHVLHAVEIYLQHHRKDRQQDQDDHRDGDIGVLKPMQCGRYGWDILSNQDTRHDAGCHPDGESSFKKTNAFIFFHDEHYFLRLAIATTGAFGQLFFQYLCDVKFSEALFDLISDATKLT